MRNEKDLALAVEALLADPAYAQNPLRQALDELYAEFRTVLHQIDRITRISDRYQSVSRERAQSLTERYQKQLRQLEKMARISDRYQSMMRELNEALKDAAARDALTGLGNRRMLMERLKAETGRAERMGRPLAVALLDVDRFKTVNDAWGHETGDRALIEIGRAISDAVRDYDVCGRWGGEEFMIIMPEIGAGEAVPVVERVRAAVSALRVATAGEPLTLTASFGVAEWRPNESLSDTIRRADEAMYAAKRAGRDRLEVAA